MVPPVRSQILITHPGRQHSHQAALALAGAGMLAGYWSGVPSVASQARLVPKRLWRRYGPVPLPGELTRAAIWVPAMRRLGDRLPAMLAFHVDFLACRLFDRWAAARLPGAHARAIIACEISALTTFRAAKRLGMTTILDAPSLHHLSQDSVQPTLDPPELHRRLARVKDAEIELADHVITVSELARDTYLSAGLSPATVHAVSLGADPAVFASRSPRLDLVSRDCDAFVFLFGGASIRRKGFDLLLDAFAKVRAEGPGAQLRIAGPAGDAASLLSAAGPGIDVLGPLDQPTLAGELARADCLVLPSRHDSYGMVVVESLAVGTPVLVSDMVGAKDLVEDGVNGWVVAVGDAGALAQQMRWCVANPHAVRSMRAACQRSAKKATWNSYHRRFVELLERLVGEERAPADSTRPADAVA